MLFKDITGHEDAIRSLREMADSDRIPHAILLSGPSGIGKMRLARAFVQYLNCGHRHDGDSCGVCPACRRVTGFSDPDIHYIYPIVKKSSGSAVFSEDYTEPWLRMLAEHPYMPWEQWLALLGAGNSQPQIYVTESRHISEMAALTSYADRFKVFVIWLPEKMNANAANALLKVIEEPHEDTLFVCVSNNPAEIMPTVYSRLRRIEMRRPGDAEVADALMHKGLPETKAAEIARLSHGNLRQAFEMAEDGGERSDFEEAFQSAFRAAYGMRGPELKSLSERFADYGREKSVRLLNYFASQIRENFIANLKMPVLNTMTQREEQFSYRFAPFIHHGNVEKLAGAVDDAINDITRNANSKVVWFDFLLLVMTYIRRPRPSAKSAG